jgi:hypothetical protein
VDLVHDLSNAQASPDGEPSAPTGAARMTTGMVPMVEYCGFVDLDAARNARDLLRAQWIRSEIVIRDAPGAEADRLAVEEYWLRVERDRIKEAVGVLGYDQAEVGTEEEQDDAFDCGACGATVSADETFCANCGAKFEED